MQTTEVLPAGRAGLVPGPARVEIVIPVLNEERDLGPSVRRLREYLAGHFPFAVVVTIADNGSTDGTWARALDLEDEFAAVRAVRIERPGRGGALRSIWSESQAEVYAYMDADLSTDLNALLPLVAPLLSGHSDVAIGTRLARGARVIRGPRRETISRCYNLLLHALLGTRFSDAQCGFKAIRADAARALLPLTADTGWFFDTELLVLAERAGLRIHEVPVDWIDDADSRVNVISTALADLRGIVRLGTGLARGVIAVPALRSAQLRPVPAGRRGQHRGLRRAVPPAARLPGRSGRERAQPVADRGGQHRRQPAVHVRHPGPTARDPPSGARTDRVRRWPGPHLRRARRPGRRGGPPRPDGRAGRSRGGQPRGHAGAVRALPGLGVPRCPEG